MVGKVISGIQFIEVQNWSYADFSVLKGSGHKGSGCKVTFHCI